MYPTLEGIFDLGERLRDPSGERECDREVLGKN
jgi:hypothetical protein